MTKKWYNLFVSVDQPSGEDGQALGPDPANAAGGAQAGQPGQTGGKNPQASGSAGLSAAQSVAQIAASLAAAPNLAAAGTGVSFDEIYRLAEIAPPSHGYTIGKVGDMLQSEHMRGLPPAVKRASVLTALEAAGVNIEEVIQDAVKRDRALDAYERAQKKSLDNLEATKTKQNQDIQAELDRTVAEYQARMRANTDEVAKEKERFFGWRLKKQQEEQKIADAVGYFLTENPITTSTSGPQPEAQASAPKAKE